MRKGFIAIILFLVLTDIAGQSVNQLISFGDQMRREGKHDESIYAYRRALFFSKPDQLNTHLLLSIADSYNEISNHDMLLHFYELASSNTQNDSIKKEIHFKKGMLYILSDMYNYALLEILGVNDDSQYFSLKKNLYLGIVYYEMRELAKSKEYFLKSGRYSNLGPDEISSSLDKLSKVNRWKPNRIRNYSLIIPGLGQLILGETREAANSFIITSLFLVLYVNVAITLGPIDSFLTILPWYHRYYTGGFMNTKQMAIDKREDFYDRVLIEVLSKFQTSTHSQK